MHLGWWGGGPPTFDDEENDVYCTVPVDREIIIDVQCPSLLQDLVQYILYSAEGPRFK
jgi:hypothetical protein